MKRFTSIIVILLTGLLLFSSMNGYAQTLRNLKEKNADKKEIAKSVSAVKDDRQDVDRLSDLIIRWDRLRQSGNEVALKKAEQQIAIELRKDIKETSIQAKQAKKEGYGMNPK